MKTEDRTVIQATGLGGCGFGSLTSYIDVKDGKVLRTRSFQMNETYDLEPWSIKARGSHFDSAMTTDVSPFSIAYKKRVYSKNRIPYPLKRVDWEPGGDPTKINSQNRGISKYERISWDEAAQICADEIKRIKEQYGLYSILAQGDGHGEEKVIHASHGCNQVMLNLYGGCTMQARNPDSWEGWYWGAKHVWGCEPIGQGYMGNLLMDIAQNADILLHWGCDLETTPWGWVGLIGSRYAFWLTEIGVKQVFVCPDLNYSAAVHADRWIPILPNTDCALQLAIAYVWIENGWYDKEYLDTHSVGFDWIERYVMGAEDGIPKTPKWAEGKCDVPSRIIKALAKQWHFQKTSIAHCNGGSYIRSIHSHEPARMEPILMGMQGMGQPGRNITKFIEWGFFGLASNCPAPMSRYYPDVQTAYQGFVYSNPNSVEMHEHSIPKTLIPEAILGHYTLDNPLKWHGVSICTYPREDQFVEYQYPSKCGGTPLHMIWSDTPCWTTCWNGGNRFIRALRDASIEFVLVQHPWLENDTLYADIILPVSTKYEQKDIGSDSNNGYFTMLYIEDQCIEPLGEARSDWECCCAIAEKLGILEEYTKGNSVDDWIKIGFEHSGAEKEISWEEFRQNRHYVFGAREDWEGLPRGFQEFCEDPEQHPLSTPTGKLEFYSQTLAENFPGDEERPPYPKWIETSESHPSERRNTPRAEKYPFIIESNHPRWRVHANMDDNAWMREIETCKIIGPDGYRYEPVWINPVDAMKLGIEQGDIVKLFNDRGVVLGGAYVTERVIPGTLLQDHGARQDPIVAGEFDRGGANNLIAPHHCASKNTVAEVTSGFLVGIEKVDVFELAEQYPEAFKREYDEAEGVCLKNWLAE